MRLPSRALCYAVAATIALVTLNAASSAHAQTRPYPKYHRSPKQPLYDYRGGGYSLGAPQNCAPFSRDRMDEATVFGDSKFLSCGH